MRTRKRPVMHLDSFLEDSIIPVQKTTSNAHTQVPPVSHEVFRSKKGSGMDPFPFVVDADYVATIGTGCVATKEASLNTVKDARTPISYSSDDDERALADVLERCLRRQGLASAANTANNIPYTLAPVKSSVFGACVNDSALTVDLQLDAIVHDRKQKERRRQQIVALRNKVESSTDRDLDEGEKLIASMIEMEHRNEKERLRLYAKYSCSLALFTKPIVPLRQYSVYWKRARKYDHPLHELLMRARETGDNLGVGFRTTVELFY
eukprot:IDg10301t1